MLLAPVTQRRLCCEGRLSYHASQGMFITLGMCKQTQNTTHMHTHNTNTFAPNLLPSLDQGQGQSITWHALRNGVF